MDNLIFDKVKAFTSELAGIKEESILETSSVEKDLGIYGDDAVEYILAFGKKFNVDVSNFMAADYFSPEGIDIIGAVVRMFTGKPKPIKTLTISHLVKAIIAGRLDEDIINNK